MNEHEIGLLHEVHLAFAKVVDKLENTDLQTPLGDIYDNMCLDLHEANQKVALLTRYFNFPAKGPTDEQPKSA